MGVDCIYQGRVHITKYVAVSFTNDKCCGMGLVKKMIR